MHSCADEADKRITAYVINLDRSVDRWQDISAQAENLGLELQRVSAVDGTLIAAADRNDYRHKAFVRANGRPMLDQEYGCYLAHLKALKAFLASGAHAAVIMEDDVELRADLLVRASAIVDAAPFADAVKLLNHRAVLFRPFAQSVRGDRVGKCAFGPQGSAACYLVTRKGAIKLLDVLAEIRFPFDVALERGWATGAGVYSVKSNVIALSPRSKESQIADRARYRSIKLRGWRRVPTHIFRAADFFRRISYALL